MDKDSVIKVNGLWKRYGLPFPLFYRKARHLLRILSGSEGEREEFDDGPWALCDVSFEIKQGETIGIIGRNGAGKSTLLKILAGVTPPTRGTIDISKRIFPMIELNAGIHTDLTGRENAYLLGAIMGITKQDMKAKIPNIESFCELDEWFDRPVRTYSSGMLARLGFGVAMNVDADVLLVDEVLAVGDMAFQKKCFMCFEQMRKSGVTVVFVSHSMRQIQRICDRVLFLNKGSVMSLGGTDEVLQVYSQISTKQDNCSLTTSLAARKSIDASGEFNIIAVDFLNGNLPASAIFQFSEPLQVRFHYQAHETITKPYVAIRINTADMILVSGKTFTDVLEIQQGRGAFVLHVHDLRLLRGVYSLDFIVKSEQGRTIFSGTNIAVFSIDYSPDTDLDIGIVQSSLSITQDDCI